MVLLHFGPLANGAWVLDVEGHCGSGPIGFDVVCGAVSGLVLTLLKGAETDLQIEIRGSVTPGSCHVLLVPQPSQIETLRNVCSVFQRGFRELAFMYRDHITLDESLTKE